MDTFSENDIFRVGRGGRSRATSRHHLSQLKPMKHRPAHIVEARALRVWDSKGQEHSGRCVRWRLDGQTSAMPRSIRNWRLRDQLIQA